MIIEEEGINSLSGSLGDKTDENIQPPHGKKNIIPKLQRP